MTIAVIEVVPTPATIVEVTSDASVVVDVSDVGLQGPAGATGPEGPQGPEGPAAGPHHATHEPGGADAIVALDAAVLTSGTLPNARLNANTAITTSVAVGTNPAQSGVVRLANDQYISARNAANSGDLLVVQISSADNVIFGNMATNNYWQGNQVTFQSGTNLQFTIGSRNFYWDANVLQPSGATGLTDIGASSNKWRDLFLSGAVNANVVQLPELAFASLPASQPVGTLANVSDSTTATIGGIIAGGGTNHVLARYDGTAWKVVA